MNRTFTKSWGHNELFHIALLPNICVSRNYHIWKLKLEWMIWAIELNYATPVLNKSE